MALFENFIERFGAVLKKDVANKRTVSGETRRTIERIVNGFEPTAKKVDEKIGLLPPTLDRALRVFIGIQIAAARNIRSLALALPSASNPLEKDRNAFFIQISGSILDSIDEYNDPFIWVQKAYTRLKEMESFYYQDGSPGTININLTVNTEHPVLKADDALVAKEILDHVIFASMLMGTLPDPVDIEIFWDKDLKAMVINSTKLLQLTNHKIWPDIDDLLKELGGRYNITDVNGGTGQIIIPLRTGEQMASPVPTAPPGNTGDEDAPTMTGFSASGETNFLAQNLRTLTAQNPSWVNLLSARNLMLIPQLTVPAPLFFNCATLPAGRLTP